MKYGHPGYSLEEATTFVQTRTPLVFFTGNYQGQSAKN